MPARTLAKKVLHIHDEKIGTKLIKGIITFILVDFSWIFFRANRLKEAFVVIKSIATTYNPWVLFDGSLYNCGLDSKNFGLMIIAILVLLMADVFKYRNIKIRQVIIEQDYWCRCGVMIFTICFILIFGVWGSGYDAAGFIYFQF